MRVKLIQDAGLTDQGHKLDRFRVHALGDQLLVFFQHLAVVGRVSADDINVEEDHKNGDAASDVADSGSDCSLCMQLTQHCVRNQVRSIHNQEVPNTKQSMAMLYKAHI